VMGGEERIESDSCSGPAGNEASPLGKFLARLRTNSGRVKVEPDLSVAGHPEIFVVGDPGRDAFGGQARAGR